MKDVPAVHFRSFSLPRIHRLLRQEIGVPTTEPLADRLPGGCGFHQPPRHLCRVFIAIRGDLYYRRNSRNHASARYLSHHSRTLHCTLIMRYQMTRADPQEKNRRSTQPNHPLLQKVAPPIERPEARCQHHRQGNPSVPCVEQTAHPVLPLHVPSFCASVTP